MLNTCDEHSDSVVVYNGKSCPVCEKISDLENDIQSKEDQIADLQTKVSDLESDNEDLEREKSDAQTEAQRLQRELDSRE